jgi:HSP20 family protein
MQEEEVMANIIRWDPFADFSSLRRAMDRAFDEFYPGRGDGSELTFPIDLSETENEVVVRAAIPGVHPEDVEINVTEGVLTIRGETKSEQKEEKENFYRREIRYGMFSRSIPLPRRVNYDQADAEFQDGMLVIRLPKAEEARPKSIKIKPKAAGTETRQEEKELSGAGARSNN